MKVFVLLVNKSSCVRTKTIEESSPYSVFVYAVRSSLTREYYLRRLRTFFDFVGFESEKTIEQHLNLFAKLGRENSTWSFNSILRFLHFQKERVETGKITGATLRNYAKATEVFS